MTKNRSTLKKIFEMQCEICKAMAHPIRLEIVETLRQDEMSAAALLEALETSKASLSKHMALLLHAGIVDLRREGRQVYYRLSHPEIHEACAIMRSILHRRLKKEGRLASAMDAPRQ
ncbi:MAG: ArsR family transcriptional regulator [Acidobacteria bacterium]|jgi:ArsR family transcriptional regulator|nr:ArsR family transcriptional regulator [Acidobacteriota bacterium]